MADDHQGAFVRQRRSLILISVVLTVVVWFGIDGTKVRLGPGGGSGVSVDLLDARVIYAGLYAMWLWLLWRYWQHFPAVRKDALAQLLTVQGPRINAKFRLILLALAPELLEARGRKERPDASEISLGSIEVANIRRVGFWKSVQGDARSEVFGRIGSAKKRRLGGVSVIVHIGGWRHVFPLLRAVAPVNFGHPYFTEYWLPLVFATFPFLVLSVRWREVFLS